jgi:hypothetical protein
MRGRKIRPPEKLEKAGSSVNKWKRTGRKMGDLFS